MDGQVIDVGTRFRVHPGIFDHPVLAHQIGVVQRPQVADAGEVQRPGAEERVVGVAGQLEVEDRVVDQAVQWHPDEPEHEPDDDDLEDVVRVVARARARAAEVAPEAGHEHVERRRHVEPWAELDRAAPDRDATVEERRRDHLQEEDAYGSLRDQPRMTDHARPMLHQGCWRQLSRVVCVHGRPYHLTIV